MGVGRVGRRPKRGAEEPGRGTRSGGDGRWSGEQQCGRSKPDTLNHGREEKRGWGPGKTEVWNSPWVARGILQP